MTTVTIIGPAEVSRAHAQGVGIAMLTNRHTKSDSTLQQLGYDFERSVKAGRVDEAEGLLDQIEDRVLQIKRGHDQLDDAEEARR